MTKKQIKGMLRFHKAAYKAYKTSGQTEKASQARIRMLETYLQLRARRALLSLPFAKINI
jgi:hypothetical protein